MPTLAADERVCDLAIAKQQFAARAEKIAKGDESRITRIDNFRARSAGSDENPDHGGRNAHGSRLFRVAHNVEFQKRLVLIFNASGGEPERTLDKPLIRVV